MTDDEAEARIKALEDRVTKFDNLLSVGKGVILAVTFIGGAAMWLYSNLREFLR